MRVAFAEGSARDIPQSLPRCFPCARKDVSMNLFFQATSGAAPDAVLADVAERLVLEFGSRVDRCTVDRVVLECRRELQGAPVGALPELVERLARQRLLPADEADAADLVPAPAGPGLPRPAAPLDGTATLSHRPPRRRSRRRAA